MNEDGLRALPRLIPVGRQQAGLERRPTSSLLRTCGCGALPDAPLLAVSPALSLAVASPGLLSFDGTGSGQGLAVIVGTGQLAAPWIPMARPAFRDELIVVYATGLGAANPQPATGAAASPGSLALAAPTVTIGGVPAPMVFAELVPGRAGLWQTLVEVPAAAPTGSAVPVVLTASGVSSNTVTIAVQ